jgi:hypothetical protein
MVTLMAAGGRTLSEIPSHIGPCEFGMLGKRVTVRCPKELAPNSPASRRRVGARVRGAGWWQRRRIGPVIRALQQATDPLFRHVGLALE